eukprot:3673856-Prymnesium_polylepis.1
MDKDTNRPFTKTDWKRFVSELHRQYYGIDATNVEVHDWAKLIYGVQKKISREIWVELMKRYDTTIRTNKNTLQVQIKKLIPENYSGGTVTGGQNTQPKVQPGRCVA